MKRKFSLLFIINLKQKLVIKQKKIKFSLVKYIIINILSFQIMQIMIDYQFLNTRKFSTSIYFSCLNIIKIIILRKTKNDIYEKKIIQTKLYIKKKNL